MHASELRILLCDLQPGAALRAPAVRAALTVRKVGGAVQRVHAPQVLAVGVACRQGEGEERQWLIQKQCLAPCSARSYFPVVPPMHHCHITLFLLPKAAMRARILHANAQCPASRPAQPASPLTPPSSPSTACPGNAAWMTLRMAASLEVSAPGAGGSRRAQQVLRWGWPGAV